MADPAFELAKAKPSDLRVLFSLSNTQESYILIVLSKKIIICYIAR
jgi:hypothetical protein